MMGAAQNASYATYTCDENPLCGIILNTVLKQKSTGS